MRIRRLCFVLLGAVLFVGAQGGSVSWAHDGEDESTAEHARQDLAGVSVTVIEKQTAANAHRLGATQRRVSSRTLANLGDAPANPGLSGRWSSPVETGILPAFQAVLPSGRVLIWDSVGDGATESAPDQSFTRAMVWDPANDSFKRVDVRGYNIFCAGFVQLRNGNVLVVGGNRDQQLNGIKQTHIFDWRTETWSRGPDMAAARWYPAVAALGNGEAVIVGGRADGEAGDDHPEVYQADGTLRTLGFGLFGPRVYPFLVPRSNGQVEVVGPFSSTTTISTTDSGAFEATTERDGIDRSYGSFATFRPGQTLVTGGGSLPGVVDGVPVKEPTDTSKIVDTTGPGTVISDAASMNFRRRQHNLTVLADGSVLATGGQQRAEDGGLLVDLDHPVYAAEVWKPTTNSWTTLAAASKIREYHSTATLLPDGRVLTGGGGICGDCVRLGYLEKNLETFSPPYLYLGDGTPVARPLITAPATITAGAPFTVTSNGPVARLGLVRLGAPTHSVDQGQRYVPLGIAPTGSADATYSYIVDPVSIDDAPTGYYNLFAVNSTGAVFVGSTVWVGTGPAPDRSFNGSIKAATVDQCLGVAADSVADGTRAVRATCRTAESQRWTYTRSDSSIRALGKCLDIAGGRIAVGTAVQLYSCNRTPAQRWAPGLGASTTIRPSSNANLCVGKIRGSDVRLELQTCGSTSRQRWSLPR